MINHKVITNQISLLQMQMLVRRIKIHRFCALMLSHVLYSEKLSRISAFFAKVYLAKVFKMAIRESLSSEIILKHQFAKVYPVKFVQKVFYLFVRHKRVN